MKYYGQFSNPRVDEYIFKEFFSTKKDGFFIECGATDGITDSSCKLFSDLGWKGINIEPDYLLYTRLLKNRPNCINLNKALVSSEHDGEKVNYVPIRFNSSISKKRGDSLTGRGCLLSSEVYLQKTKKLESCSLNIEPTVQVGGISFKSLVSKYSIKEVDLFVLDVEGSELNVIEGMKESKALPKILVVEVEPSGLINLQRKLEPLGYIYYSLIHNNAHFILKEY